MSLSFSKCTELIHRALRVMADEGRPLPAVVAVPEKGTVRLLIPDDTDLGVLALFRVGLSVARCTMGITEEVVIETTARSSCEAARRMLAEARLESDEPLVEGTLQSAVSEWLVSRSATLPLLQIIGSDSIESRPTLTRTLQAQGLDYRSGKLVYLPAREAAGLLRARPESDECARIRQCQCLVLQGMGECPADWPVLSSCLSLRAGLGKWTVLVDHKEPEWLQHEYYGELLRPATEVVRTDDAESRTDLAVGDRETPVGDASSDSDRELILVAASVVAKHFGVTGQSLINRRSNAEGLKARQAAIFVARKWKRFEFSLIGRVLGERTQVSAAQAYRRIEDRYRIDPEYAQRIDMAIHDLEVWERGLGARSDVGVDSGGPL